MIGFLTALQFLTILPVRLPRMPEKHDFTTAMMWFPAVGLLIGLILAAAHLVFGLAVTGTLLNVCVVVTLVVITGGLHLDGLADSFDGLGARRNREETLAIMRDSHIGTMGVLALISAILLKVYLFNACAVHGRFAFIIIACMAASRGAMLIPLYCFPYARAGGKAAPFTGAMSRTAFITGIALALAACAAVLQLTGVVAALVAGAGAYAWSWFMNRTLGGITGDVIGAVNELAEILFLIVVVTLS